MNPAPTAPGEEAARAPSTLAWLRDAYEEGSVPFLVSLLILLPTGSWLTGRFGGLAIFWRPPTRLTLGSIRKQSITRRRAPVGLVLAVPTMPCLWLRKL